MKKSYIKAKDKSKRAKALRKKERVERTAKNAYWDTLRDHPEDFNAYYAVYKGKRSGIYKGWDTAHKMFKGDSTVYKTFASVEEARDWLSQTADEETSKGNKVPIDIKRLLKVPMTTLLNSFYEY